MRRLLLLPLVMSLLAGCVQQPAAGPSEPAAARAFLDPIVEDHEHTSLEAHNLTTPSMRLMGHSSLGDETARFTGFGEMDTHGDLAVVAAQRIGGSGSIVLVDVRDPAAPARLAWAEIRDAAHPLDVKFDAKGEFVYASATGHVAIFDVRDPTNPTLAGVATPPGAACHMSALGVVAGAEYFFCTGDPTGLTVYRVVEATGARALVPLAQSRPSDFHEARTNAGTFGLVGAPHDMTFQPDPVDGRPLLVVSNRGFGVRILDVGNPALPVELGRWQGEGAEHTPLHFHTGMVDLIDGKRYVIVSPEILPEGVPPAIWILDATDYAHLRLVAEWTAPGDHPSPGFTFTTHQWQIADGRLYLGYYHAGVWVLDVRTILAGGYEDDPARPDVLGYFLPHEAPVVEGAMVPNVWDLNLQEGVIWVTDISSGLYALHHRPDALGNPALTGWS